MTLSSTAQGALGGWRSIRVAPAGALDVAALSFSPATRRVSNVQLTDPGAWVSIEGFIKAEAKWQTKRSDAGEYVQAELTIELPSIGAEVLGFIHELDQTDGLIAELATPNADGLLLGWCPLLGIAGALRRVSLLAIHPNSQAEAPRVQVTFTGHALQGIIICPKP